MKIEAIHNDIKEWGNLVFFNINQYLGALFLGVGLAVSLFINHETNGQLLYFPAKICLESLIPYTVFTSTTIGLSLCFVSAFGYWLGGSKKLFGEVIKINGIKLLEFAAAGGYIGLGIVLTDFIIRKFEGNNYAPTIDANFKMALMLFMGIASQGLKDSIMRAALKNETNLTLFEYWSYGWRLALFIWIIVLVLIKAK